MNSFDNYIDLTTSRLISISEDCPSNNKRNIPLNSLRNNSSNIFSKSIIKKPSELLDISKTSIEFDIQLSSLKKKLLSVKEQKKESENKVNLIKLRIKKLLIKEKESLIELENIKKTIQKILNNRKKYEQKLKKTNKTKYSKIAKNNSSNINNLNFLDKNRLENHKSFLISMKKNKFLNKIQSNFSIVNININRKKNYISSKRLNKSTNDKNKSTFNKINDISCDSNNGYIYGINSIRNASINLGKLDLNNNKSNYDINNIDESKIDNDEINNKKDMNNILGNFINKKIKNRKELKSQIKINLENKLKEHEEQRNRIQEEIKKIEDEQYNLWMNFNEKFKNEDTNFTNNLSSNRKIIIKSDLYNIDDDDNILNYNFK